MRNTLSDLSHSDTDVVVKANVSPQSGLALLSQREVSALLERSTPALRELFRRCALAVLSSGLDVDDARTLLERYHEFDVAFVQTGRGLSLDLKNAPAQAFVDGRLISGVRENLFAVFRDIVYTSQELKDGDQFDLHSSAGITDVVFKILRNTGVLQPNVERSLVVCWGGHAIGRKEYDYSKQVGYSLGLRGLDICTGCGAGAMKGPMKGATIAHAKQRMPMGRYIGISEPKIIAAEAPNPIVNKLIVMPDMEKRLESFVRLAHGVIIFPGGVGTAEELLYLLGVLAAPDNREEPMPVVLTGPRESADYFMSLDGFIRSVFGKESAARYRIVLDDAHAVAQAMVSAIPTVFKRRHQCEGVSHFNWDLDIGKEYQEPFVATHAAMSELGLSRDLAPRELAQNLRRVFSGLVAGNVKEDGIAAIEREGPFKIRGEREIMLALDAVLMSFIEGKRMRLAGGDYRPCYEIVPF